MTAVTFLALCIVFHVGVLVGRWRSRRDCPEITRVIIHRWRYPDVVHDGAVETYAYDGYTPRAAVDALIEASKP